MTLRASILVRSGSKWRRRSKAIGLAAAGALALASVTGCQVNAGSAVVIDGTSVPESGVLQDTAAYLAEQSKTPPTDAQKAALNRAQITYLVRHSLIAKAVTAQGIVITDQQRNAVKASVTAQNPQANLTGRLGLPGSDEAGVVNDVVALELLVKALPAAGVPVQNVSVTAEGVPAASRDEAVSLRSKYLANPDEMDAAVSAAGEKGIPEHVYDLLSTPAVGSAGLYQPSPDQLVILPGGDGYVVLRATGRTVKPASLTQSAFSSANGLPGVFDLGALLVSKYQAETKISVNPRYGVWDPASVQVVPGNDGL